MPLYPNRTIAPQANPLRTGTPKRVKDIVDREAQINYAHSDVYLIDYAVLHEGVIVVLYEVVHQTGSEFDGRVMHEQRWVIAMPNDQAGHHTGGIIKIEWEEPNG